MDLTSIRFGTTQIPQFALKIVLIRSHRRDPLVHFGVTHFMRSAATKRQPVHMPTSRIAARFIVVGTLMASIALGQQITVYGSGSLAIGQTKQLTAYVPLAVNTVTWSVNGVLGGDSTNGTVSATDSTRRR